MISCIVLAAGESQRFGSPKPLARINGKSVIEIIQENLLATKTSEIIVVLGSQADAILPLIRQEPRIKYTINKNYLLGQTSSFKAGLQNLDPGSKGIMLLPADMPYIKPATIDGLINMFLKKSCLLSVPIYQSRRGHPPIFSVKLKSELLALEDDIPISTILGKYKAEIMEVPVDDEGVILSFNTPQELENISNKTK